MRRYSPVSPRYQSSPPRRGYGGGGGRHRSPPPRRGEGRQGSLLVRNIPLDCRPEELKIPFERFGAVRDVYLPKDYHTGQPRGFAFVQFVDSYEAAEAQYQMDGRVFAGREISVVVASESRKRPEDMRRRTRTGGPGGYGGRRPSYREYSRSRSRSRSPRYRSRQRSRSSSPAPRGRGGYSVSPDRRQSDRPRYSRDSRDHLEDRQPARPRRSYSPAYANGAENVDSYEKKTDREAEEELDQRRSPPPAGRASRSPSGSRSRSADISPRNGR